MRRHILHKTDIIPLLAGLFALTSLSACVKEQFHEPTVGDGTAWVNISFGHMDFDRVRIETKATLDIIPESRVKNLFVYMFSGEKRIFSHYFDQSCEEASLEDMIESDIESWYVSQYTGEGSDMTHGAVHLRAPECTGATVFIIANIDCDMVNISPEKLNMISTKTELLNLVASLNQEITSRNGLFPMTGLYLKDGEMGTVDVTGKGMFPSGSTSGDISIELRRLDAKVKFNVRVASENEIRNTENGETTTQTLKKFVPESWQVVNLPKGCRLAQHDESASTGYFSTDPVMFESIGEQEFKYRDSTSGEERTVTGEVNGFSFYMLENPCTAKRSVYAPDATDAVDTPFHNRERKNKDADGHFDENGEMWKYAPENGTYVIIKGEVTMDVDVTSEAKRQQLAADVTYYVHLGNIAESMDNYSVIRNTEYTYTITIKGVNSIEVEVSSSQDSGAAASPDNVIEKEPGAEGMVYIAKESIYTFDAHYGQRVFCFDAAYIDADAVTWYVKTPFGKEGTPDKIGDVEIPSGMDYEWVQFMINGVSDSKSYTYTTDGGATSRTAELDAEPFSRNNRPYPGDGNEALMDVVGFVEYVKEQKKALDAGQGSDFRTEFDQDWFDWYNGRHPESPVTDPNTLINGKPGPWFRHRIYVTAFVNEFYYEKDPITGESDPLLWKRFVNQPNRLMHILCDNEKSLDGASSSTGSVVTIRQRSIQTPYSVDNADLVSAWGCETEDENAESYLWFFPSEKDSGVPGPRNLGCDSKYNGLYNTARLWGVISESTVRNDIRWSDFIDYDRPNDFIGGNEYNMSFLKEDKACMQYSAMMRNRDNNGNGIIDLDEIRWYTASIGQLEYLYLGELGLHDEAKLYPRQYSGAGANEVFPAGHPYAGNAKWKCHVVSSTWHSNQGRPQILWAEEGVSVSAYKQWETGPYTIKCVRNLGFEKRSEEYFFKDDEAHRPQDLVVVTKPEDDPVTKSSVYRFDTHRINSKSKRFRTSVELEPYDENSEMARLYEGFETGEIFEAYSLGINGYESLRRMLQNGKSPCPDGYRVPNIREVTLLHLLADDINWWGGTSLEANTSRIYTSSYYSMGILGNGKNGYAGSTPRISWNTTSFRYGTTGNINLDGNKSRWIRCVRDWNPETED